MKYTCVALVTIVLSKVLIAIKAQAIYNSVIIHNDRPVIPSISTVNQRLRRNLDPPPDLLFQLKANQTNRFWVWDATNHTCGHRGFCNKTHWIGKPLCSFECKPRCNCDDQCHLFGDCCPDLMFQNSPDVPSVASPYVSCLANNWTKWSNVSSVLMVDSCPADSGVSEDIVKKCQEPDNVFQDQATPVITSFEKITYRNKFCAQCHGKTDYEGWRHQVTCEDGTKLKGVKSKDELWRLIIASPDNCHIQTSPPTGLPARQCKHNFIGKCNVTGSWGEYDPVIEELCALYDHPVDYYGDRKVYKEYKNIFCAVCNGAVLTRNVMCSRHLPQELPHSLSVLLEFNPESSTTAIVPSRGGISEDSPVCEKGQVFDPFTMTCRPIICPEKRVLDGDSCIMPYSASTGIGVWFSTLIKPANDSIENLPLMADGDYMEILKAALNEFKPLIVYKLNENYYSTSHLDETPHFSDNDMNLRPLLDFSHKRLIISGTVISLSLKSLLDLENTLLSFLSTDLTFFHREENVTLSSSPRLCGSSEKLEGYIVTASKNGGDYFRDLPGDCKTKNCQNKTAVYLLTLDCPFLEYNMSTGQNFTYNATDNSINLNNLTVFLNDSDVLFCEETLKLCLDAISYVDDILSKNQEENSTAKSVGSGTQINFAMAIVSLVCITLSLIGLFLTFIIYSIIPKLRSLPGLNTMALVFHLFCAQLLFLVGSNRTESITACKVLGVSIHFFWIGTFCWMGVSAYRMHSVFAKLRPLSNLTKENHSRYYKYWALCFVATVVVVSACIIYSLVRSDWDEIGYGGQVCFINDPIGIAIFFAGPLGLILIINAVFFILTVIAIQGVPDMSETSNKTNKHHLFVYVKLSLLFGFTWIFGILAAILNSEVLRYIFIVLTGTQGLFLFMAYCVNKRTWNMLKTAFKEYRSDRSSNRSDKPGKYRKSDTTLTTSTV